MINSYIGITDRDWFDTLKSASGLAGLDEVNFWKPGGSTNFRALRFC
ncbi:MAG: hypothetical protein J5I65_16275 [Aridibacter famidurans]|nr:hypothetical protein [Aridibacter famidurans]